MSLLLRQSHSFHCGCLNTTDLALCFLVEFLKATSSTFDMMIRTDYLCRLARPVQVRPTQRVVDLVRPPRLDLASRKSFPSGTILSFSRDMAQLERTELKG